MADTSVIQTAFEAARQTYAAYGVDVDAALDALDALSLSLHCWQGDDVTGLETDAAGASGGIMATGNYPGKARTGDELRQDLDRTLSLLPGRNRVNLHMMYAELAGEAVDRDAYDTRHFRKWIDWARARGIGLDFNATCFGHPMAASNLTLSNPDETVRSFWVRHVKAARRIAADIGRELGTPCIHNLWIPDGMKDQPADRSLYRRTLLASLDEIFAEAYDPAFLRDAVECKLFGIGSESYVVGSHEFYMGYLGHARAAGRVVPMPTLDMGHFHPTETIADKIPSMLLYSDELLVHVSRGVRWDSDHVVLYTDDLLEAIREIRRAEAFDRVHLALDFFDASINRVTAWVTGSRAAKKAMLAALLEPTHLLHKAESDGRYGDRLALMDEFRTLPVAAVWNAYCLRSGVPAAADWLADVAAYERDVLSCRA